jgi:hypothetical protein
MNSTLRVSTILLVLTSFSLHAASTETLKRRISIKDETSAEVRIDFAAGVLQVAPGDANIILDARIEYDKITPKIDYFTRGSVGILDIQTDTDNRDITLTSLDDVKKQDWNIKLGTGIPIKLDLELGAAETYLDFGGLMLEDLKLECGASQTEINFSKPNPVRCDRMKLESGVSDFSAVNLLNARVREIRFEGGVGSYVLDFGGELTEKVTARLEVSLGSLDIRLPRNVPFFVDCDYSIFSSVSIDGAQRLDDHCWQSFDLDKSQPYIYFDLSTGVGSINLVVE